MNGQKCEARQLTLNLVRHLWRQQHFNSWLYLLLLPPLMLLSLVLLLLLLALLAAAVVARAIQVL